MSRSSTSHHRRRRRSSKKRTPVFLKDDKKVVSMDDIESIRKNISFGPRLRFDGANDVTEVSEEETKSEVSKKNLRRRRSKSTKRKVNSRKYKETNKMKEDKLWRWVGRLENSLENTWDSMKGIMESNSMNHRTFSRKVDKIEKYLSSVDNDIAEEIREGDDYALWVEKTVDSALDFNKAISKMNNVVHMLRESDEEMKKTNWRLINACKTAEQLVQKLVHAQNNVSLLQIHGINHQEPNGSMFSELSTTLFHSNKILHSLYNIAPKMFHSETVLGQHVNETESLSQKVAANLRQILQTRAPDTVSTATSASVSVASDLDKTTDTVKTSSTQADFKIKSFVSSPYTQDTNTTKTTLMTDKLCFDSGNTTPVKATSASQASILSNSTGSLASNSNTTFPEAEVIENYRNTKNNQPEADVATAKAIRSKTDARKSE